MIATKNTKICEKMRLLANLISPFYVLHGRHINRYFSTRETLFSTLSSHLFPKIAQNWQTRIVCSAENPQVDLDARTIYRNFAMLT
ncbi:hypothetical protein Pla144_07660 [Bythopirellula polymerisocia]|uniref:Uncharacterized protein n=1 Tax=Bythopirellula polymerisocia TaxID=2528003 RepID=A0A5C6D1B6_9BACT|nr:hypothetical protein Pla144_07660 [Bythopirellula polymerisocia]